MNKKMRPKKTYERKRERKRSKPISKYVNKQSQTHTARGKGCCNLTCSPL